MTVPTFGVAGTVPLVGDATVKLLCRWSHSGDSDKRELEQRIKHI